MALTPKGMRLPSLTVIAGILLGAYYILVFQPLSLKVRALDKPLIQVWDRLALTNQVSPTTAGLSLDNFEGRLRKLQTSVTNLTVAGALVQKRVALSSELFKTMSAQFQLIDFQNERLRSIAQLAALAKEKGAAIEPAATNGLPEYVADMPDPVLLWARLHAAHQALATALHCKVGALRAVNQLPTISHRSMADGAVFLQELPMRVEVVAPMDAASRFLAAIPLTSEELKSLGLAQALTNKPAMFLDQVLVRKHSPERPYDVSLEATLCTFVPWTETRAEGSSPPP